MLLFLLNLICSWMKGISAIKVIYYHLPSCFLLPFNMSFGKNLFNRSPEFIQFWGSTNYKKDLGFAMTRIASHIKNIKRGQKR